MCVTRNPKVEARCNRLSLRQYWHWLLSDPILKNVGSVMWLQVLNLHNLLVSTIIFYTNIIHTHNNHRLLGHPPNHRPGILH